MVGGIRAVDVGGNIPTTLIMMAGGVDLRSSPA